MYMLLDHLAVCITVIIAVVVVCPIALFYFVLLIFL